jgi:RNA polymerase sigma factor (sigma-70 family)
VANVPVRERGIGLAGGASPDTPVTARRFGFRREERMDFIEGRVRLGRAEISHPPDHAGDQRDDRADAALVQACLEGDECAWETMVERYGRLVYSVARRCGLAAADADDVFQIVFTTLFRRLNGLRDQTRLSSWLITTTQRESWRVARADRAARSAEDPDDIAAILDPGPSPAALVIQAEREQLVRDGLARLDDRCRALLTTLFLEAEAPSYEAIGRRLGMPIGSIGPTRARCFKKLEAILIGLGLAPERAPTAPADPVRSAAGNRPPGVPRRITRCDESCADVQVSYQPTELYRPAAPRLAAATRR